jgi:signal transduction histidine kinase
VRPLERLPTIRAKLGSTIVFAVAMTLALVFLLLGYALRATPRAAERLDLIRLASAGAADVAAGRPLPPAGTATLLHVPEPRTSVRALGTELPAFGDGRIHAGAAEGVDYAAVPVGEGSGYVYAVRRVPGEEIADRLAATFRFLTRYSWQFLLAGLISAGIALALARWLARGMTQPLRDMAAAARRMAGGDYRQRVTTRSRDEVGQLAEAFNRMSAELEGVERLRRELVANVSHELKTPISALRAHLENLLDGVERPDPETLQVMLTQSERLSRLVEQLLDLSRLESGDVPLRIQPVALGGLVAQVLSEIEVARPGAGVALEQRVPPELPPVRADQERIHQVLFNLVDNAVRFTPPGGRVTVAAEADGDRVRVWVRDTGVGIPPEHLPRLFERFYRADPSRARGDGGTGIGLAICRSVVEAHGGRIWAESAPGGGSTFTFELPAAALAGQRRSP